MHYPHNKTRTSAKGSTVIGFVLLEVQNQVRFDRENWPAVLYALLPASRIIDGLDTFTPVSQSSLRRLSSFTTCRCILFAPPGHLRHRAQHELFAEPRNKPEHQSRTEEHVGRFYQTDDPRLNHGVNKKGGDGPNKRASKSHEAVQQCLGNFCFSYPTELVHGARHTAEGTGDSDGTEMNPGVLGTRRREKARPYPRGDQENDTREDQIIELFSNKEHPMIQIITMFVEHLERLHHDLFELSSFLILQTCTRLLPIRQFQGTP